VLISNYFGFIDLPPRGECHSSAVPIFIIEQVCTKFNQDLFMCFGAEEMSAVVCVHWNDIIVDWVTPL